MTNAELMILAVRLANYNLNGGSLDISERDHSRIVCDDLSLFYGLDPELVIPLLNRNQKLEIWLRALAKYQPQEVAKDEFAYDRLLEEVHVAASSALAE